jgi:hypothetical protein
MQAGGRVPDSGGASKGSAQLQPSRMANIASSKPAGGRLGLGQVPVELSDGPL